MYRIIEKEDNAEFHTMTSCINNALNKFKAAALVSDYVAIQDEGGKIIKEIGA